MDSNESKLLFDFKYIPSKNNFNLLKQHKNHVRYLRAIDTGFEYYTKFVNTNVSLKTIRQLRRLDFKFLENNFPNFILYTFSLPELLKASNLSEDTPIDTLLHFKDIAFKESIINYFIESHIKQIEQDQKNIILRKKSDILYRIQQLESELDNLRLEYKKIDTTIIQQGTND